MSSNLVLLFLNERQSQMFVCHLIPAVIVLWLSLLCNAIIVHSINCPPPPPLLLLPLLYIIKECRRSNFVVVSLHEHDVRLAVDDVRWHTVIKRPFKIVFFFGIFIILDNAMRHPTYYPTIYTALTNFNFSRWRLAGEQQQSYVPFEWSITHVDYCNTIRTVKCKCI